MQRVDADLIAPQHPRQPAVRLDAHLVRLGVLHRHRVLGVFAMVVEARLGIHLLVDVAAQGHVDFLHAAADAEDRQATGDGGLDQRQVEQVAVAILTLLRGEVLLAVEGRVDVRTGTGQVHAVGHVQVLLEVVGTTAGGHQHGYAAGDLHQRRDVFVGHYLVVVALALLGAHGHQHDGFTLGSGSFCTVLVGHTSPWGRSICRCCAGGSGDRRATCLARFRLSAA